MRLTAHWLITLEQYCDIEPLLHMQMLCLFLEFLLFLPPGIGFIQSIMKGLSSDAPPVVHVVLSTLQTRVSVLQYYSWQYPYFHQFILISLVYLTTTTWKPIWPMHCDFSTVNYTLQDGRYKVDYTYVSYSLLFCKLGNNSVDKKGPILLSQE